MDWIDWILQCGQLFIAALTLGLALLASGHAIVRKRDSRAASLWVVIIILVPLAGSLFYFIFGINRIKRRAILLRGSMERYSARPATDICTLEGLSDALAPGEKHLTSNALAISRLVERPLLQANSVTPLINGDEAYPAMLEAIANAQQSVSFSTYIFDHDEAGLTFAKALGEATRRGVEVRVLLDATGTRYSWPSILGALKKEGVRHARFLPTFPAWQVLSMNLRNHRKILVADGRVGFTGGLNIRAGHCVAKAPEHPTRDLHFRLEGPVVGQLQEVFADDWFFTTREALRGDTWFPLLADVTPSTGNGSVIARGIADGPDEDFEIMRWAILAALTSAQKTIRIATPYFLPEPTIISALNLAAMRGVVVDILLPGDSNVPIVQWAATAQLWQVIERGCRVWYSAPPFDHSKIFIVDDSWSLIGSTNWDPRSLRLNFEFNVECYDPVLAQTLSGIFDGIREESHRVTLEEVDARPLPIKLRDSTARLFAPFL